MFAVTEALDLTLYGCPMHYIKAREALRQVDIEQDIELLVNQGDAVNQVMNSLRQDGQHCELVSEDTLTATIRVKKRV